MSAMPKLFMLFGAIFGGLAVAFGAFGAHGLKTMVGADRLAVFETAVRYQFFHAIALVVLGLLAGRQPSTLFDVAGWLFVAGIVVFSGSLYLLVLTDTSWLGAITPIGGVAMIAGWAFIAVGVYRGL